MPKATRRTWWSAIAVAACSVGCLSGCSSEPGEDLSEQTAGQRLQGELKRVVISDPERGLSRFDYFLELADGSWLTLELDAEPDFEPNVPVVVHGQPSAAAFHVEAMELVTTPGSEELGSVEQQLIAASPKRVAVVLFNFSNDTSQPIDAARAKELVFSGTSSSNSYFKEVSYGVRSLVGSLDMTGDVFGWYTLDETNAGCAYQNWGTAARAKAQAAGVNLANYEYVVHYFPRTSTCGFSGVGQLPGKYSWINSSGSQTISHELGHNFGVHHASSYRCVSSNVPVPIGGTCTASEYGDPFDVMGSGYRHLNAYHKEKLGFLETVNVQTVSANGTFDIAPLEQKATGLQVLRFPIAGTSDVYYVEYRQPFGFDSFASTSPVSNGVLIRRITIPSRGVLQTKLIDNAPATTSFTDAPLLVGKTFTDSAANVSFTLTARTASSATVQVTLSGAPPMPPTGCGAGETELSGHCYFATTSAQTLSAARTTCTSRGAGWNLVSIESAAENSFVSSLVGSVEHWLSGGDATTEGTFVWVSGGTFWTGGLSGSAPAGAYANFVSGEPNDSGDCLRMVSGGQWRDVSCTASYRAVCEK